MAKVFIEWTVGVIRGGPEAEQYPAPYNFVCTILRHGDYAYLMAACGEFTIDTYRAIKEELKKQGIKKVEWDRRNNGFRAVTVDIKEEE